MLYRRITLWLVCCGLFLAPLTGMAAQDPPGAKDATEVTVKANDAVKQLLNFGDTKDFENAQKGFIRALPEGGQVQGEHGLVWDMKKYAFINNKMAPPRTVNPSLWRQSQLVMIGGLFKVTDRLYQVRNADLSNMTIYEGDTGLIVADPLICEETARYAMDLYNSERNPDGAKKIVAVIYSHSHVDHFGGVRGIIDEKDVIDGKIKIYAPAGFMEAAVSENVYAGNAMSRRAGYMYGNLLPPGPKGQIGAGLGMTTSTGHVGLIAPTNVITKDIQKEVIDGLHFEFLLTPHTEAPAEMHWYISELRALTAAENCSHTMHNTYSLRGAKIRDPLAWSKYMNQTIQLWADKADVLYGMHHWPDWGKEDILRTLRLTRDGYRFINDQTLHFANMGYTLNEIPEMVHFPKELEHFWAMRGYYGTLYHNVKATYVLHLGWFDGNPCTLHILQQKDADPLYVKYMGGAAKIIEQAKQDFDAGHYRWVAQVLKHVIFAEPKNMDARNLAADALEQLGYQAESGPWRNFYLSGAQDLRSDKQIQEAAPETASPDIIRAMTPSMLFDFTSIRINPEKFGDSAYSFYVTIRHPENSELKDENFILDAKNNVLNHLQVAKKPDAEFDSSIAIDREALDRLVLGESKIAEEIKNGTLTVEGAQGKFAEFLKTMTTFTPDFPIVLP
ncbi:alkyl/aryl-sulfatase [Desulfobaculum bizertense]|uniref:Alkyl sulfatase BDS1, metallo-beta-lactamase superfamily n=1 Tax=Desulfobaculum bizertense DSM 18034 TaxID=1121442 RepID=A0A1T4WJU8_9BACT|nr:alkyl sulfatase dimerization domain-containing protein [Desulfobaculum bizertense]SKA77600.1 Alkyl sulfatase BDS1, metallo-beta-lactamase superfamily [Desulfobaculum bizertense DSM 18034]